MVQYLVCIINGIITSKYYCQVGNKANHSHLFAFILYQTFVDRQCQFTATNKEVSLKKNIFLLKIKLNGSRIL